MVIFPLSLLSWVAIAIILVSLAIAWIRKIPLTYALIVSNFLVFGLWLVNPAVQMSELGFRPIYLEPMYWPQLYTLFTSMFVHGGILHILGNMLVFFFMGIAFEDRIGRGKFLLIYLVAGVCGALAHSVLNLGSTTVLIGASGAIFGILGGFAYAYPWDEVVMPVPIGIMFIMRIKVLYAAILFALIETVIVFIGTPDSTAHYAHFGGLIAGIVLSAVLVRGSSEHLKKPAERNPYGRRETPIAFNLEALRPLATTPELQSMLDRISREDVPQARDLWLDHFFEKVRCPVCGKPLQHEGRRVWCYEGHFQAEA
jgi:membrane associated rhomboid family serine protease